MENFDWVPPRKKKDKNVSHHLFEDLDENDAILDMKIKKLINGSEFTSKESRMLFELLDKIDSSDEIAHMLPITKEMVLWHKRYKLRLELLEFINEEK